MSITAQHIKGHHTNIAGGWRTLGRQRRHKKRPKERSEQPERQTQPQDARPPPRNQRARDKQKQRQKEPPGGCIQKSEPPEGVKEQEPQDKPTANKEDISPHHVFGKAAHTRSPAAG